MSVRVLDYSALTEPVSRADVSAWRTQARASGASWARGINQLGSLIGVILAAVFFVFIFGGALGSFLTEGIRTANPTALLGPTIVVVVVVLLAIVGVRARFAHGSRWEQWMRLDRFAAANAMTFRPMDAAPAYPGEIFHLGRDAVVVEHLLAGGGTADNHFLDLANYRYITGSGKSQTTHNWGFLALALDRAMPNIVLDSRSNNSLFGSNLPALLSKSQILHLEGDFDKHFTLYCPKEYETDALYILTPDLMALLIDEAAPYDVELVDRWMFVYSSKPFQMTDPAVLQRLFRIADTVGAKALTQTAHYADDRVGNRAANIVAPQGARLKRGVSVIGIVVVAGFAVFWGWNFFGGFFSSLFGGD